MFRAHQQDETQHDIVQRDEAIRAVIPRARLPLVNKLLPRAIPHMVHPEYFVEASQHAPHEQRKVVTLSVHERPM